MSDLNRVVLITGADRGLGFALTKDFLNRGDTVFAGQYMEEWQELKELQRQFEGKLYLVPLDISDRDSIKNAYKLVAGQTDHVDILVNNAGISGKFSNIVDEESVLDGVRVFKTNCMGPLTMVRTFFPLLNKKDALKRLCFVSSEAGSISVCHREDGFPYTMSKAGLNMTVRLLFEELYQEGFTFRLYHPGWMRTYMQGTKSTMGKIEPEESSAKAMVFFSEPQKHEDVLRLIDNEGTVWPF
ncbi:MAG: SDR family NAD(P)-dependent oxidoreductase [Lachnospiraceae bacterium]|nr:SDR family NAD(P)-dependent oxidoreductase [Lachnospiraceae bacterium]